MEFFESNIETWSLYAVIVYGILLVILLFQWIFSQGALRGIMSWLCRVGWTLPILTTLFPQTQMEALPSSIAVKPVHVLLDDSKSMMTGSAPHFHNTSLNLLKEIETECLRIGCVTKVTKLSDLDTSVEQGYTPLKHNFDAFIQRSPHEPWILLTDGADSQPMESWKSTLRGTGVAKSGEEKLPRGLIIGFEGPQQPNIWVKALQLPPFSFEMKPLQVKILVGRSTADTEEVVQVQLGVAPGAPTTINVKLHLNEYEATVDAVIPSLTKGQHLIEIRALPTASEQILWDNKTFAQLEVLPNTFGVLHLLGSPSWDGRFLRRYLKGEPKYDLISFFILRDPWDSQQVHERELSLIPFPVERLFRDELPNFRVVIIQNFTLFQFLLPEYQNNLVKFVQDGGGLLFLGGPRALHAADLLGSPLKSILPFEVDDKLSTAAGAFDTDPWDLDQDGMEPPTPTADHSLITYDPNLEFKIELAKPTAQKRALANVYDDWEHIETALSQWKLAKGIHRMDRVRFKEQESTILLNAIPKDESKGKKPIPLAVASYPGKGRALWLFSDSLWQLAMTMDPEVSRQTYNQFMHSSMTWLMRQDLKKPLLVQDLTLNAGTNQNPKFSASLKGPSVRYFQSNQDLLIKVCGSHIQSDQLVLHRQGDNELELSGSLASHVAGGKLCEFSVEGHHPAFGSVRAALTAAFPETYKDEQLFPAPHLLEDLATFTEAKLLLVASKKNPSQPLSQDTKQIQDLSSSISQGTPQSPKFKSSADTLFAVKDWLSKVTGTEGVSIPTKFRALKDFYWFIGSNWIYFLLMLMPLEVTIRRWPYLFMRQQSSER